MDEHSPVPYTPTLNIDLLERVRQIILMRPELHNQDTWGRTPSDTPAGTIASKAEAGKFCGTTACVAGWAAILGAPEHAQVHDGRVCIGAYESSISMYAARLLGLSGDQQIWLFTAAATRERVLWTLKWLPDHPDGGRDELQRAWQEEMCRWREGWL